MKKKVTKSNEAPVLSEPTASKVCVDRLDLGFPNEDMNRVVAKLNEVIDKLND